MTKEEYSCLYDYAEELKLSNPGTTYIVKGAKSDGDEVNYFHRFYVCFGACKEGWLAGCRRIIGMDGCFLKGICRGQLLCAIGCKMFPSAWAVVQVENTENWSWFLRCLKYDLPLKEGDEFVIINDMQKGLERAIKDNLPEVEHRRCARHVYAALAKNWRGEDRKLGFWTCAKATFTEVKCDVIDNNLAETFNGWILDARGLPIISMLEVIRVQVMTRLRVKRRVCLTWINDIAPRAMKKLERNKELSFLWHMIWNGDTTYEVTNIYNSEDKHTVNTATRTCTCREWDLSGIPCQHAIAAIYSAKEKTKKEPEYYVHEWYKEEIYKSAYSFMMQPVRGRLMWPESELELVIPPYYKKMPGRPKQARRRDIHETTKTGKISRHGRVMRCKLCKEPGHNIKSCPRRYIGLDPTIPLATPQPRKNASEALTSEVVRPSADLVNEFTIINKRKRGKGRQECNVIKNVRWKHRCQLSL
ncbi:uncharacterized protein LOC126661643 [Mercurialis annua]|uniref:uncharacterized protein LOC126661643 n=1 Tax=Mercurialis annua TaxID=3986 RepID=UPI00215E7A2B|nr:uncharacterized protein LOC126661643 [Mercurialis annua]